jgi:hypothetical protein
VVPVSRYVRPWWRTRPSAIRHSPVNQDESNPVENSLEQVQCSVGNPEVPGSRPGRPTRKALAGGTSGPTVRTDRVSRRSSREPSRIGVCGEGSRCEQAGARPTAGPMGASDRRRPRAAHRPAPAGGRSAPRCGATGRSPRTRSPPALGARRIAKVTTNHQHGTITLSPPSRPMGLRGRLRAAAAPDRRRSAPGSVGGGRGAHRQAVSLRWAGAEAPAGVPRRPPPSARSGIPW